MLASVGRILSGLSTGTALLVLVFTVLDVCLTNKPVDLDLWASLLFLVPKLLLVFKALLVVALTTAFSLWTHRKPAKKVLGSGSLTA